MKICVHKFFNKKIFWTCKIKFQIFILFFMFYTIIYNFVSKYFLQLNNRILSILLFKIVLFFSISKLYLKNENNIDNWSD